MKKLLLVAAISTCSFLFSQSNNNGQLDTITEFTTIHTVWSTMPDGVRLSTDIYLPIISDSVTTEIKFGDTTYVIQIIPKGTQLFVYDSLNSGINPNKYQLPMVFTRTPYNKGTYDEFGVYMNVLGYAYALQDMRGRYQSEGVYLPMYSDAWDKSAYHPNESHSLDITSYSDPKNGVFHQDGRYSIDFLIDSLYKTYDLDGDGTAETTDKIYNGSLVMFGASALGNTQYQAASAFKNDVSKAGLKGLVPIVATNEHFNCVLQHNGVFRQSLVQGWLTGQLQDNTDTIPSDVDLQNAIHSMYDYGNIGEDSVINLAVDYITTIKDINGVTGMYPTSILRKDANANFAPVNALGESDANGQYNRYTNLELPMYHLTGWWDIFIDGQLDTYNYIMDNTSEATQRRQKVVIGPWTHRTISQSEVADLVFPESVHDIRFVNTEVESAVLTEMVEGDLVDWFRYLLNNDPNSNIGEPKVFLPESDIWQNVGESNIRIPAKDTYISYSSFINYLSGYGSIEAVPIEIETDGSILPITLDLPADTTLKQPNTTPVSEPVSEPVAFENIPNIRYYVPGPIDDGISENTNVGNYWTSADEFPLKMGWRCYPMYLHGDGTTDTIAPTVVEEKLGYDHDPNDPIITIGGGNLVIPTPDGSRENSGPMNYSDTSFAKLTMDRSGVISFESELIRDSLSIVGVPKAKIYASSTPLSGPDGPTDTDFFIRVLDVYPDGREIFVVEGAVNARARHYAKQLATGEEDITIPYSNITSGEIYEYEFRMLPIAYTFGHGHKMKILISSSNWPRYQCSANVPIEEGDFFRRTPDDGKKYSFQGTVYSPRIAHQEIFFSPEFPSQIIFPLYDGVSDPTKTTDPDLGDRDWLIYPNPAVNELNILTRYDENYTIKVFDVSGNLLFSQDTNKGKSILHIANLSGGVYIIKMETDSGSIYTQKFVKI